MKTSAKERVIDLEESLKLKKRQLLRNNEYYSMQDIFDELYEKSCNNEVFNNLIEYIKSEQNILLAYRNIKKNKGSTTVGIDEYENLVWISGEAHKLIHATTKETIEKYLGLLSLNEKGLKRVNSLRKLVGNSVI